MKQRFDFTCLLLPWLLFRKILKLWIFLKSIHTFKVCFLFTVINKIAMIFCHVLNYEGYLRQNEMWISLCEMIRLYSIDDTERVLPLDTYYDCRYTGSKLILMTKRNSSFFQQYQYCKTSNSCINHQM